MKKITNKVLIIVFSLIILLEIIVTIDYSMKYRNYLQERMAESEQTNE